MRHQKVIRSSVDRHYSDKQPKLYKEHTDKLNLFYKVEF